MVPTMNHTTRNHLYAGWKKAVTRTLNGSNHENHSTHAIVIGAGFTGCALAYDLAQRGFAVMVVERGELASGTSGRTHGLLHSGARYCVTDAEAAIECIQENIILRRIAKQCIEYNAAISSRWMMLTWVMRRLFSRALRIAAFR